MPPVFLVFFYTIYSLISGFHMVPRVNSLCMDWAYKHLNFNGKKKNWSPFIESKMNPMSQLASEPNLFSATPGAFYGNLLGILCFQNI